MDETQLGMIFIILGYVFIFVGGYFLGKAVGYGEALKHQN